MLNFIKKIYNLFHNIINELCNVPELDLTSLDILLFDTLFFPAIFIIFTIIFLNRTAFILLVVSLFVMNLFFTIASYHINMLGIDFSGLLYLTDFFINVKYCIKILNHIQSPRFLFNLLVFILYAWFMAMIIKQKKKTG